MSFLQPLLLWGLLAASIPVIIHLLNRRRHRTIKWAAMQFLLKATRESRGRKRLRHILILTCRTLGIAALAFAAARPLIGGFLGWGGGSVDLVVLVLDRSASMENTPGDATVPKRQAAIERVSKAVTNLGATRLVLIDSASATPQEVPSPDVLPDLTAAAATDTRADLPALLATAVDYLVETSASRPELWIASDLQESDWAADSDRWQTVRSGISALPRKPAVRVLAVSGKPAPNQSLRVLAARRTGDELALDLEVLRQDDPRETVNLPLTVALEGVRTTESITLGGDSLRFQRSVKLPPGTGTGHGWVSLPGDANPRDSVAFFAFGPPRPVKTFIVAAPGETADYLKIAAAPPGLEGLEATAGPPGAAIDWDAAACVIWAAPLPEGRAAEDAKRFLTEGGVLVLLPPAAASAATFLDHRWTDPEESAEGKFFIAGSWDREDGLLRDGIDGSGIPADRLRAVRRQLPDGGNALLARWDDGKPLLTRVVLDKGTAWFFGTLPDYTWSNLGDGDLLLPLIQRAVLTGAERFETAYLADVASTSSKLATGETRVRVDDHGAPDAANAPYEAGVWRLGERLIALNRPAAEDLPVTLPREALGRLLADTNFSFFEDQAAAADAALIREAWRAFLLGMLFFLFAEALLCLPKKTAGTAATPADRPLPPQGQGSPAPT